MSRRARVFAVAGALVVAVWVGLAVGLALSGGGSSAPLTARRAGDRDSPVAVWLFGYDTLRLDPAHPRSVERLGYPAFGSVAGGSGGVALFDPSTGAFGFLDATTNRIVDRTVLAVAPGIPPDLAPVVTSTDERAWATTGPGQVTRHERTAGAPDLRVALPIALSGGARATPSAPRLASSGSSVVAAYQLTAPGLGPTVALARLDATSGAVLAGSVLPRVPPDLVTLAVAGDRVWLVSPDRVITVDLASMEVRATATLPPAAPGLLAAAVSGGRLSVLDDHGDLRALSGDGTAFGPARALLAAAPEALGPTTGLVASPASLWALLPGTGDHAFRATLVEVDPASGAVRSSLRLPEELGIGAVATSLPPPPA